MTSKLPRGSEPDFRALFESAPGLYLVLEPDPPRYTIVAASDLYLRATMTKREEILGRGVFDVFPDNPADPEATGVTNLTASLGYVLRTRRAHAIAVQKYDIRRSNGADSAFEERYWSPVNSPIFARDGALTHVLHSVEDVTERVHLDHATRDALRSEEARFRELFESAPDGIFVAGADGRYTDVNAAACRLLGYAREELLGRAITEFVSPADLPRQAAFKRRIAEGGAEVSEWQLRRKDGTYADVELSANRLPNGDLREFARDITKRRRAEVALRVSESRASGIVAISADAIVAIDDSQRITMFNHGAERVFGYSSSEAIGAPLDILIPERYREVHRHHVQRFSEGSADARPIETRGVQIYGMRKSGEVFPADASISKIQAGGSLLLNVFLRDVSEQKRIEREERLLAEAGAILIASASNHERLLADVADVIVHHIADFCSIDLAGPEGVRRLRLVHADPEKAPICAALEQYRVVPNRSPVPEVLSTGRSVLMSELAPGYLESLAQDQEHLRLIRALDPGSFIIVPLIARGQTLGSLGLGASRTSRRYRPEDVRMVERLGSSVALAVDNARTREALERSVRERDEVLGIVAHDLRNPLNAIMLQSDSLRRRCGDEPERRNQRPFQLIHRAALRMNALIQDLLDVARLEAGQRLTIGQAIVPTGSVLAEAVEHQQAALATSNRALQVDAPEGLPDAWADRARTLQVLDNLLGNALKFSREAVTLGASVENGQLVFRVADDGPGVPAADVPRLFDRFWQASRADRRGAGLGLSIVKGIVDAHGGRVWVESQVGVGTTFYFTLPIAPRRHGETASGAS